MLRELEHVSWVLGLEPGTDSIIVPYNKTWKKGVLLVLDDCQHVVQVAVTKTRKMLDKIQLTFSPKVATAFSDPTRIGLLSQARFYVKAQGELFVTDTKGRNHKLLSDITSLLVQADNQQGIWLWSFMLVTKRHSGRCRNEATWYGIVIGFSVGIYRCLNHLACAAHGVAD